MVAPAPPTAAALADAAAADVLAVPVALPDAAEAAAVDEMGTLEMVETDGLEEKMFM